ncbi:hypothetical protein BH23BAC1_BH23BAC1_32350 [soil metagenome]
MQKQFLLIAFLFIFLIWATSDVFAQNKTEYFIYGDQLPDAPELSARGKFGVGVRTMDLINKNQIDVLNSKGGVDSRYNRTIKIEVWYPIQDTGVPELTEYEDVMGIANDPNRPLISFNFPGRAVRNAAPDLSKGPYPLIIVSHGYLGSRLLFTYLTENLASKGYVVVSIDHPESTFQDPGKFPSTLLNRPLDDLFVLNEIASLGLKESKNFLTGLVDAEKTALIGYSMGGYGVLNVAGAGFSPQAAQFFSQMTEGNNAIIIRTAAAPEYKKTFDIRIKAIVAFAPWGMERGVWNEEGLEGITIPTLFVAGDQDDISGYEKGVKAIYEGAKNSDRYLLTYLNARHNVAPNPPPFQSYAPGLDLDEYLRYAEPAWDERRINNINQHFVTAFLGIHLKGEDLQKYLKLPLNSNDSTWTGFKPRTSVGMEFRHSKPK